MNNIKKRRTVILLALTEVLSRAIAETSGKEASRIVSGQDIGVESDSLASMAINKQMKVRGGA